MWRRKYLHSHQKQERRWHPHQSWEDLRWSGKRIIYPLIGVVSTNSNKSTWLDLRTVWCSEQISWLGFYFFRSSSSRWSAIIQSSVTKSSPSAAIACCRAWVSRRMNVHFLSSRSTLFFMSRRQWGKSGTNKRLKRRTWPFTWLQRALSPFADLTRNWNWHWPLTCAAQKKYWH